MEDRNTILVGCEILCLGFWGSDYVGCPLPLEEQKVCRQRLQYQAGIREVVEELRKHKVYAYAASPSGVHLVNLEMIDSWQAELKKWRVE